MNLEVVFLLSRLIQIAMHLLLLLVLLGRGDSPGDGQELVEHSEGSDPLYCCQTSSINHDGPWIAFLQYSFL